MNHNGANVGVSPELNSPQSEEAHEMNWFARDYSDPSWVR